MDNNIWVVINIILQVIYGFCTLVLFLFGLNSLLLSIIYLRKRKNVWSPVAIADPPEWPCVTIQLPMYNERYMVKRLLEAVTDLDYPAGRLQIQVLDDSNDATVDLIRPLVDHYRENGIRIQYIHRTRRKGFKAGALNEGLRKATGEFVAVFDADFMPDRDWLKKVIPHFQDPKVGFVQTRWGHKNDRYNLLTLWESLALDGHFIVEQGARAGAGLLMSFNGSAGIWRKAAIEDAGGWKADTLTEDLDLSYRCEFKGWTYRYLPEVIVESEVPAHIDAVKKQQYRWSKGTVQVFRKLGGTLLRSNISWGKRIMGLMHLSMYLPFPFIVFSLILVLPVGKLDSGIFRFFPWTIIASFGPPLLYSLARTEHLPRLRDRLVLLPGLLLLGMGISLNCGLGALDGLFHKGGTFERTPKFDLHNGQQNGLKPFYLLPPNPIIWGELAMGVYNLLTLYILWPTVGKGLAPWLLPSAAGFFMVAGLSLVDHWRGPQRASKKSTERNPALFS
jgi:cellulose synthase/poly-beta-1,6-N-acetylglucosamine synthase-like glycosyltransferase